MSSDHDDLPLPAGGDAATDDTITGSGLLAEKAKRLQKLDAMLD